MTTPPARCSCCSSGRSSSSRQRARSASRRSCPARSGTPAVVAASRYIGIRIMLPDRPGQLARVAQVISEAGANVVEVLHTRHGQGLVINEVALDLSIEARGPEHAQEVIKRLHEVGFRPELLEH
ncbi:ACT domain-containing protein [Curtobacterium sp. Csp1]|uniref:ACT domain-containing protein n=1 Tax=Curtobacterium sp. Csp1 TaxID=2495429 RepID=UPI0034A0BA98